MMKNILVLGDNFHTHDKINIINVNRIEHVNLRFSKLILEFFKNGDGWLKVHGVIWRFEDNNKFKQEYQLLRLIEYSKTPCINNVAVLLNYSTKINTMNLLENIDIPTNPIKIYYGNLSKLMTEPTGFPAVIKSGDYQCGYGKTIIRNKEILSDMNDFSTLINDYITIEKYIDYKRDIRCLIIDNEIIFVEKQSANWKANVNSFSIKIVSPIHPINDLSLRIKRNLKADVVGIDWIQDRTGKWTCLEANLIPDLYCMSKDIEQKNKSIIVELLIKQIID